MARPCPTIRGRRTVPRSQSGTPKRRQNTPNVASSAATRRSHHRASSIPPATAYPSTAATTGLDKRESCRAHGSGAVVGDGAAVALGHRLEVGAGAEGPSGSGEDGDRAVLVVVEGHEGLAQLVGADAVHRVAALGPVDGHDGDRPVVLNEQGAGGGGHVALGAPVGPA